jgi:flagellar biosynthesis/type III secretory pathway M-ring protein FliF/YscJ
MKLTWKDVQEELKKYVTLDRFTPVERVVYAGVGIILTAVLVAVITLVIRK